MEKAGLNDTLGATVVLKHWLSVDAQLADGSSPSLARTAYTDSITHSFYRAACLRNCQKT